MRRVEAIFSSLRELLKAHGTKTPSTSLYVKQGREEGAGRGECLLEMFPSPPPGPGRAADLGLRTARASGRSCIAVEKGLSVSNGSHNDRALYIHTHSHSPTSSPCYSSPPLRRNWWRNRSNLGLEQRFRRPSETPCNAPSWVRADIP